MFFKSLKVCRFNFNMKRSLKFRAWTVLLASTPNFVIHSFSNNTLLMFLDCWNLLSPYFGVWYANFFHHPSIRPFLYLVIHFLICPLLLSTIHLTSQLLPSKWTGLLTDWSGGLLTGAMVIFKSGWPNKWMDGWMGGVKVCVPNFKL